MGFLNDITRKRYISQANSTWETPVAEEVLWTEGGKSESKHIGRRKVMEAQWVALRLILEVCVR